MANLEHGLLIDENRLRIMICIISHVLILKNCLTDGLHFDVVLVAFGNYLPTLNALLVIIAFSIIVIQIIKPTNPGKWSGRSLNCLIIAFLFSLISFIVFNTVTVMSGAITGLILLAAILQYYSINRDRENIE